MVARFAYFVVFMVSTSKGNHGLDKAGSPKASDRETWIFQGCYCERRFALSSSGRRPGGCSAHRRQVRYVIPQFIWKAVARKRVNPRARSSNTDGDLTRRSCAGLRERAS